MTGDVTSKFVSSTQMQAAEKTVDPLLASLSLAFFDGTVTPAQQKNFDAVVAMHAKDSDNVKRAVYIKNMQEQGFAAPAQKVGFTKPSTAFKA